MDKIAVLIPCYNESQTIEKVVKDFKKVLPEATIYVYDNNSSDGTDEMARNAGAVVRYEYQQGKGNVIRSMFRDIDAECLGAGIQREGAAEGDLRRDQPVVRRQSRSRGFVVALGGKHVAAAVGADVVAAHQDRGVVPVVTVAVLVDGGPAVHGAFEAPGLGATVALAAA